MKRLYTLNFKSNCLEFEYMAFTKSGKLKYKSKNRSIQYEVRLADKNNKSKNSILIFQITMT